MSKRSTFWRPSVRAVRSLADDVRALRAAMANHPSWKTGGSFTDRDTDVLKPGNEWVQDGTGVSGQRPRPTPSSPREGGQ